VARRWRGAAARAAHRQRGRRRQGSRAGPRAGREEDNQGCRPWGRRSGPPLARKTKRVASHEEDEERARNLTTRKGGACAARRRGSRSFAWRRGRQRGSTHPGGVGEATSKGGGDAACCVRGEMRERTRKRNVSQFGGDGLRIELVDAEVGRMPLGIGGDF
jgi:hypothetical protein